MHNQSSLKKFIGCLFILSLIMCGCKTTTMAQDDITTNTLDLSKAGTGVMSNFV